ncbi:MAG: sodium:proton antiporter [Devosiaceae bacterium]|nr:sodium:proton antiporter [Devosiaceae bacterium MH13]
MHDTVTTIALIGTLGIGAQWIAWRTQIPAIVLLLLAGLLAGPATGLVNPAGDFGDLLKPFVALAVAIILFEGGMTLNFAEIRGTAKAVRRIIIFAAPLVWVLGSLAAHYIGGLSWPSAIVFSGIMVVTGPTVIMPLLRQAKLPSRTASVLRWEAIVVDPIGALFAVIAFEVVVALSSGDPASAIALQVLLALLVGVIGGFLLTRLLAIAFARGLVPDYLKAPILLVAVLAGYAATDAVLAEAGLVTMTVMGIVLANAKLASFTDLRRFKEIMTVILVSGLFIVLTASITVADIASLSWRDGAYLVVLLFVVRPVAILLATIGTELSLRERLLVGWIAPRGVVAVAVSGLFAGTLVQVGIEDGARLAPLAFLVVLVTVILHGFSLKPLARMLGITSDEPDGFLIVGANKFSLALAEKLKASGLPLLIVDRNRSRLFDARQAGFPTYYGEILSEAAEHHLDLSRYGTLLATTDNDAYNALVSTDFGPELGRSRVFRLGREERREAEEFSTTVSGQKLFKPSLSETEAEARMLADGWTIQRTKLSDAYTFDTLKEQREDAQILFAVGAKGGFISPALGSQFKPGAGATVFLFGPPPQKAEPETTTPASQEQDSPDSADT